MQEDVTFSKISLLYSLKVNKDVGQSAPLPMIHVCQSYNTPEKFLAQTHEEFQGKNTQSCGISNWKQLYSWVIPCFMNPSLRNSGFRKSFPPEELQGKNLENPYPWGNPIHLCGTPEEFQVKYTVPVTNSSCPRQGCLDIKCNSPFHPYLLHGNRYMYKICIYYLIDIFKRIHEIIKSHVNIIE